MSNYAAHANAWDERSQWWAKRVFPGLVAIVMSGSMLMGIALLVDMHSPAFAPLLGVTTALGLGWGFLAMLRASYAENQFLQFRRMQLMDEEDPSDD